MTRPTTSDPAPRSNGFRPGGPAAIVCFLGVESILLAVAHVYGGPPWTLLMMLAMLAQVTVGVRLAPLALLAPSVAWLAAFRATGNRELFFPFAMHLATFVALLGSDNADGRGGRDEGGAAERTANRHPPHRSTDLRPGLVGGLAGGGMLAMFLAIRAVQNATARVLAVESVVALVILAAASAAIVTSRRLSPGPRTAAAATIVLLSSLAAYAALAL